MKKTRKIISCLLAVVLLFGMALPATIAGAEEETMAGQVREYYTDQEKEFTGTCEAFDEDAEVLATAGSARVTYSFKASSAPSVIYGTVALNDASAANNYIHFYLKPSNVIGVEIRGTSSKDFNVTVPSDVAANIYDGEWHTVVFEVSKNKYYSFTFDSTEVKKEETSSTLFANNLGIDITKFSLGGTQRGGSGSNWTFTGSLKDVKIENCDTPPVEALAVYDGSSTVSAQDATAIAQITSGTVATAFKLDESASGDVTLFGVGSDALTVNPVTGEIKLGSTTVAADASRIADTAQWHTLIAEADGLDVTFILDGSVVGSASHAGLFADSSASAATIGDNVSNVTVYVGLLDEEEVAEYAGETGASSISAYGDDYYNFYRQSLMMMGDEKSVTYRIPALVQAGDVTIAAIDERKGGSGDSGAIDLQVRLSYDNGETWQEQTTVSEFGKPVGCSYSSQQPMHIDPCLAYDDTSDTVYLVVDMFPESSAAMNLGLIQQSNGFFTAELEDGTEVIMQELNTVKNGGSGNVLYGLVQDRDEDGNVLESATVYEQNSDGKYAVSQTYFIPDYSYGQLYKDPNGEGSYTEDAGNIFVYTTANAGELSVTCTMYVWMYESHDQGKTWSNPVNITGDDGCKQDWMQFCGTAPGSGIVISGGKYDGRIVFPCYFTNGTNSNINSQSSAALYSDDGGKTWKIGNSVNEIRLDSDDDTAIQTFYGGNQTTENSIVQVSENGKLRVYCRNTGGYSTIVTAVSYDGGENWVAPDAEAPVEPEPTEPEPTEPEPIEPEPAVTYKLGDVNEDDKVDAQDATLVLQYYATIIDDLSESQLLAAEVEGNEVIDSTDATIILQYYAEIIDVFPVEQANAAAAADLSANVSVPTPVITEANSNTFPDSCYEPLKEVYCQLAAITYHDVETDKYYVVISNPLGLEDGSNSRSRMGIHIRELDYATGEYAEGSEWITKQISDGAAGLEAYSALTTLADGKIGAFWELSRISGTYYDMVFQSFSLDYLLSDDQLWPTEIMSITGEVNKLEGSDEDIIGAGDEVIFTVNTHDPVYVTGKPSLVINVGGVLGTYGTLITGGTEKTAEYISGSGTTSIKFSYTVTSEDKGAISAYGQVVTDGNSKIENAFGAELKTMSPRYTTVTTTGMAADNSNYDITASAASAGNVSASSGSEGPASNVLDNDTSTIWHTSYGSDGANTASMEDKWIQLDLGSNQSVNALRYLPRQDGNANGRIFEYEIYVCKDGETTETLVAEGTWSNNADWKIAEFDTVEARYVKLKVLDSYSDFVCAAELRAAYVN